MEQSNTPAAKAAVNPVLKLALEMGPLVVFFGTYAFVKGGNAEAGVAGDITRIVYRPSPS